MTTSLQKARELFSKRDRATRSGGLNLSPESGKTSFPVCPECGSGVVFDSDKDTWRCADGLCYWEGESDSFNLYDEGLTDGDMEATGAEYGPPAYIKLIVYPGQVWRTDSGILEKVLDVTSEDVYWEVTENAELEGCKGVTPLRTFQGGKTLVGDSVIKKAPQSGQQPQVGQVWRTEGGIRLQITGIADKRVTCHYYSDREPDGSYPPGALTHKTSRNRFIKGKSVTLEIGV